jgi:hypothetical protein
VDALRKFDALLDTRLLDTRLFVASALPRELRICQHSRELGARFVRFNFHSDQWWPSSTGR